MSTTNEEIDVERLKKAAMDLGEYYDTVQIFATRYHSDAEPESGTMNVNYGIGNWFARLGFVRDWLIRQDEWTRASARTED